MAKRQRKYRLETVNVFGDTTLIESPISIDFDVDKAIYSNVCNASFTLYNLGENTRNALYKDLLQTDIKDMRPIAFYAGYESEAVLHRVFKGTIARCYSYRQGVDFITVIEANSGSDFLANSYVSGTLEKGAAINDVLLQWAATISPDGKRLISNFPGTVKRYSSYAGPPDKLIQDYTSGAFFLDDGDVLCMKDEDYQEGLINIINSDTGLLGSPQRESSFILFDVIFEPRILMGQRIELQSDTTKFFNGVFKVVGFHHAGTISESICGTAKTTVRVVYGSGLANKLVKE